MAQSISKKIDNFSGGIADSSRNANPSQFLVAKHFDVFSDPSRLIPYRSLEADTNDGATDTGMKQYVVRDFVYASTSAKLYGLGQTGAGLTKIVQKADAISGLWTTPDTSEGNGAVQNGCLIEYKDYLWGFQGTTQVFKWGLLSGTPSITNSASTVGTITSVAQGLIFGDFLYLPYNNKIWRATDATTFSDAYLTLPTNFKITSLTTFGKYIAIGCAPISTFNGKSMVFIWDGISTDVQDDIPWGEGELRVLENIEGYLVGITDRYLNVNTGAGKGSMIVQMYSGGVPQVVKEVFTQKLTGKTIPLSKAVKNNRLFWSAKIMTNSAGTLYDEGVWSFGRKNSNYTFALSLDVVCEEATTAGIQAFGMAGNFVFVAHSSDGSISKTNDSAVFTYTSIYESTIFDFGNVFAEKRLDKFKVSVRTLTSGESVTVKMKKDPSDTSWTTIGTLSTVGEVSRTFINIESSSLAFPSGKEMLFQILSTGGAEVTGFSAEATLMSTI